MVSFSSLGNLLSVGSSSKPSHPPLPIFLRVHRIQEYFKKKKRGGGAKTNQDIGGEGQAQAVDEANKGDNPIKLGCWLLGVGPHEIRS